MKKSVLTLIRVITGVIGAFFLVLGVIAWGKKAIVGAILSIYLGFSFVVTALVTLSPKINPFINDALKNAEAKGKTVNAEYEVHEEQVGPSGILGE